jgi:hypothetical protein
MRSFVRPLLVLVMAAAAVTAGGCVHGGSRAAAARTADADTSHPSDGLIVSMVMGVEAAVDTTASVLEGLGYVIENQSDSRGTLRTRPRPVGGDTSLVIMVQVIGVDLPDVASMAAISATYSVPSLGIRGAQLRNVPGTSETLWMRLRDLEHALRQRRSHVLGWPACQFLPFGRDPDRLALHTPALCT